MSKPMQNATPSDVGQQPDPKGPRIPVKTLYFREEQAMPGSFYGTALQCDGPDRQKNWRCDYLPKMGFYEVTYNPPPGGREKSVTTMVPREWARFE